MPQPRLLTSEHMFLLGVGGSARGVLCRLSKHSTTLRPRNAYLKLSMYFRDHPGGVDDPSPQRTFWVAGSRALQHVCGNYNFYLSGKPGCNVCFMNLLVLCIRPYLFHNKPNGRELDNRQHPQGWNTDTVSKKLKIVPIVPQTCCRIWGSPLWETVKYHRENTPRWLPKGWQWGVWEKNPTSESIPQTSTLWKRRSQLETAELDTESDRGNSQVQTQLSSCVLSEFLSLAYEMRF